MSHEERVDADVAMIEQGEVRNRVLHHLAASDFDLLSGRLEFYRCPQRDVLVEADAPLDFVYFIESGVASVIAHSPEGHRVEVGLIGREGYVHPAVALGADRIPHLVQMQVAGDAYRIAFPHFLSAIDRSCSLRRILSLIAQAYAVQTSCTTLAIAVQSTEQRLGRWLLMCHDRCGNDSIALTHDFLAVMLSVRRPSVTNALHILEGERLIRSERGAVVIRDRDALERYVGTAYGKPEAEYRRLLWPM